MPPKPEVSQGVRPLDNPVAFQATKKGLLPLFHPLFFLIRPSYANILNQ
jgi:hypothetical protein